MSKNEDQGEEDEDISFFVDVLDKISYSRIVSNLSAEDISISESCKGSEFHWGGCRVEPSTRTTDWRTNIEWNRKFKKGNFCIHLFLFD